MVTHTSNKEGSAVSKNSTHLNITGQTFTTVNNSHLEGSRIISLQKLHDAIRTITQHSAACKSPVDLIGEVQRNGLSTTLLARCDKCNEEFLFTSCNKINLKKPDGTIRSTYQSNVAAVMGQMSTGGGCNSLEELLCTIGVPSLSKPTFIEIERLLGTSFENYLGELMLQAGLEEKKIAIQNNKFHQGVPAVTVIVDGGWSKRTHKHSYNANSGVGVIFGAATKKLLYMGVKNKYCAVCSIAQRKSIQPSRHMCFKNWTGSSTSMEADIISSGFQLSESMHGLRYMKVIGDGDSSVLYTIHTTVQPYGKQVEKIECANHAVKCYRSRLEQLTKDFPSFRGHGGLTKSVILKITHGARCAICQHSVSNDINKLRNDLRAGPKHYLGIHDICDPSWCSAVGNHQLKKPNLHDLPPNLMFEVEQAGDRLVSKAAQLISNNTTNLSECYMSIRAKMDGGKQKNRIQSGSFEHRCMAAGLSLTLGPGWIATTWKHLFGTCSTIAEKFATCRKRKHEHDTKRRSSNEYKRAEQKNVTILHHLQLIEIMGQKL